MYPGKHRCVELQLPSTIPPQVCFPGLNRIRSGILLTVPGFRKHRFIGSQPVETWHMYVVDSNSANGNVLVQAKVWYAVWIRFVYKINDHTVWACGQQLIKSQSSWLTQLHSVNGMINAVHDFRHTAVICGHDIYFNVSLIFFCIHIVPRSQSILDSSLWHPTHSDGPIYWASQPVLLWVLQRWAVRALESSCTHCWVRCTSSGHSYHTLCFVACLDVGLVWCMQPICQAHARIQQSNFV